ncbi:cisplatin damage response ATP-dependent DNA ligase [Sphingobium nicotianae]|uniref:DNA ligase (ATP) n=1 Tax=Sphingobium nicotianae TaxID=2782607 RepID=A0A9X1DFK8_9SPHN|nr:cisplatin damage response ATP-dependent DNA ligase [Sphingobium nicotianae]MBT2189009.1 cisplatin damage response ATP-dependent DNA ligase [Sphingobium nicotianae]
MERFAALLDRLIYTRSRNDKIALVAAYLRETPDPDRGWALAALTSGLNFPAVKASTIRDVVATRVDPLLYSLSRDFVGDTAETASLIWPRQPSDKPPPTVSEAVETMAGMSRSTVIAELSRLLDRLEADGRFALLKMATGALRIGLSGRLARTAFARAFNLDVDEVEEHWHGAKPPYADLFAWATTPEGQKPAIDPLAFKPFMLAHPLEEGSLDLKAFAVEWKWDGIRIQLIGDGSSTKLFSRGGEEISGAFPEIASAYNIRAVMDGELLVRGDVQGGEAGSFNALQQRLGRKKVTSAMLDEFPAFVRLYDLLVEDGDDLRALPWMQRRARLERAIVQLPPDRFDLSQVIEASDWETLVQLRDDARTQAYEGLMFKRRDSIYSGGRKVGLWYKWKRQPLAADCVLMYAQRGSGKRSSYYSDYTFGCWTAPPDQGGELLPVGKAYFGFTDEELKWLDAYVRKHTANRFGPVREVEKTLVLEVAFDSIHLSKRHKSGLAMRFPRIARIRTDKPAEEANLIADLMAMVS